MVRVNYKDILDKLFTIWTVCYGAITIQTVAGYFCNHVWLPYIGFLLMLAIIAFGRRNLSISSLNCSLMTHFTVYTLAVSGLIMLIANLMNTNFITNSYSEFSHKNYPFHVSFIIYPVATIFYGIAILRQSKPEYCKACKESSTFSIKEALRRNLLHNEAKVHIRLAFAISLMLTIVTYCYYFVYYRSNNSYKMYTPDIFFMYIFPTITYIISVVYIYTKYAGLQFEISLNDTFEDDKRTTRLRFLVVWKDKLLLKDKVYDDLGAEFWDTPAERVMDLYENIPLDNVKSAFMHISGAKHFRLRKLFTSNSKMNNIIHYAVFLPDDDCDVPNLSGEWLTLLEVDDLLHNGLIARPLAMELHRIHTITMAWKTYDREGYRIYPIKNYRPTFRLRDFKDWDVDYEDLHWMSISENNQDKPFFKLRKFWRKYINGIERRWNSKSS